MRKDEDMNDSRICNKRPVEIIKKQKDCIVPAIGQMYGCLTTESSCHTLGTRGQGLYNVLKG